MAQTRRPDAITFVTPAASHSPARVLEILQLVAATFIDNPELRHWVGLDPWTLVASEIADELGQLLGPRMPLSHGQVIAAFSSYVGARTRASSAYARKLRHLLRRALSTEEFARWLNERMKEAALLLDSSIQDGTTVTDESIVCRKGGKVLWALRRPLVGVCPATPAAPVCWWEGRRLLAAVVAFGEQSAVLEVVGEDGERLQRLNVASCRNLPYRCTGGTWFMSYMPARSLASDEHALVCNAYYFFHYPTATSVVSVTPQPKPLALRWRIWSSGRAHAPVLATTTNGPTVLLSGVLNLLFCHHPDWPVMGKSEFVRVCGSLEWEQPSRDVQSFDGRAGPGVALARWRWLALLPPVPTAGRIEQGLWQDQSGLTWAGDSWRLHSFGERGELRSAVWGEPLWHWFGPGLSQWMSEHFLGGIRGQVVRVPQFDEPRDGYEWFCRYWEDTYIPAVEEMADWVKAHWRDVKDAPFAEHWKPWLARARACKLPPYETYISFEDKG